MKTIGKNLRCFYSIFKNDNDWNEKSIVGFMAFAVMVTFAVVDLVTGYFGKDLVIQEKFDHLLRCDYSCKTCTV